MLALNAKDFRFRIEDENILLAYDVIKNNMYFFKGKTKQYLENLINKETPILLDEKYINFLLKNNVLIKGENNEKV